jgi:Protein of unknown function (DUF3106)
MRPFQKVAADVKRWNSIESGNPPPYVGGCSFLNKVWALACVGAVCLIAAAANAQVTNPPGSTAKAAEAAVESGGTKSPVAMFRELLNMDPAERAKALADRREETRKRILAKIREYQSLKPDERELRLKVTELGYYLRPLMQTPATNRAAQLSAIPEGYRDMVQVRLEKWDSLSPAAKNKLLLNDTAMRAMTELTNGVSTNMVRRAMLTHTINSWNRLTPADRQELTNNLDDFFQLKPNERQKAVRFLSPGERVQIAATLQKFGNLTANQRAKCIQSFEKLAAMSPDEQQQFFRNAERWEMMTPREREEWRKLVETAPSLPPYPRMPHVRVVSPQIQVDTNRR